MTPAFPKLIYVLDEHNALKGGEYDYITKLAVRCSAKRMYPDYYPQRKCVKIMKEMYLAAWDAAVSLHRGKMKTVIINLRDVLTWVLSVKPSAIGI